MRLRSVSSGFWDLRSSKKRFFTVKSLSPMRTVASPLLSISFSESPRSRIKWLGREGAAMVATAAVEGIFPAAWSTAAPPREWPMSSRGASWFFSRNSGGGHQVAHVGREGGFGEIALALSKPSEVEPKDGNLPVAQRVGDARRRLQVLGAGKTVGKKCIGDRFLILRKFEPRGKL